MAPRQEGVQATLPLLQLWELLEQLLVLLRVLLLVQLQAQQQLQQLGCHLKSQI